MSFVICCEGGLLERRCLLLVESIRRFGGSLANAEILTFQMRAGKQIQPASMRCLQHFGAHHIATPLNTSLPHLPLANKWIACLWAQNNITSDIIVFIDTDMVVFGELRPLLGCLPRRIALRPVDRRIIGAPDWRSPEGEYWRRVFRHFGISLSTIDRVETTVDGESILAYFNSGLIAAPASVGFFEYYAYSCEQILQNQLYHPRKPQFVDQVGLSVAVYGNRVTPKVLPRQFNCPIHLHNQIAPQNRFSSFESMATMHYHDLFDTNNADRWLRTLADFDCDTFGCSWLREAVERYRLSTSSFGAVLNRARKQVARLRRFANRLG